MKNDLRLDGPVRKSRRLNVLTGLLLAPLVFLSGCVSIGNYQTPESLSVQPMEVFIAGDASRHPFLRLLIFPCSEPAYAPGTGLEVAWVYRQELLRQAVFSQVEVISETPRNREDALWQAREKGFDLVMFATITYLLDNAGAQPSQLEVETQILEARTGRTLWYVRQKTVSRPGPDVGLAWSAYTGQPARPYKALAKALGEQLAAAFLPPNEDGKSGIPPRSPASPGGAARALQGPDVERR